MKQYRIVRDGLLYYKVQIRRWFWPFWVECWGFDRTYNWQVSVKASREFIENHKTGFEKLKFEIERSKWQTK